MFFHSLQQKYAEKDPCGLLLIFNNGSVNKGVRGGVYFEAGYANSKGKEVICTCYDDEASQKRRHFDIMQLNTIFWTQKKKMDLIRKIYYRIMQSEKIGPGPFVITQDLQRKYSDWFLS